MKLSVVIPVYNCERYIENCLNSILVNNDDDYELIIVNDGSNDNTREIIENISDRRIKLYNNENHGVSYSRNFGLTKSSGEYVMFVDADDYLSNDWHEKVFNNLKNYDLFIFSNDNISNDRNILARQVSGVNNDGIIIAAPFSKIYKRDVIKKYDIKFNEKIINGEDMLFNLEYIKKCKSILNVKGSFYRYRINFGSATKSFNNKILDSDKCFQLELRNITDDEVIINSSGANGLFTIIDRLCYVTKFSDAKKIFNQIDMEFYQDYDLKYLNKSKEIIIKLATKKMMLVVYWLFKIKHFIIKKIRKEYIKEI